MIDYCQIVEEDKRTACTWVNASEYQDKAEITLQITNSNKFKFIIINRDSDIRPNIYFAVSKGTAKEFLEAVNPKTEVNPVRYYTIIFENDYSGFIPQNMSQDFYHHLTYQNPLTCPYHF